MELLGDPLYKPMRLREIASLLQLDKSEKKELFDKIGVNINQIAKKVNTTGDLYPEEMQELKEMVKEIWHILKSSPLK